MVFPTVMSKEDSLPPYLLAQTENNRKLTNTGMSTRNPSCGPGCRTETWRKHFVKTTTGQPSRVPSLLRSFVLSLCYHSINLALLPTTLSGLRLHSSKLRYQELRAPTEEKESSNTLTHFHLIGFYFCIPFAVLLSLFCWSICFSFST